MMKNEVKKIVTGRRFSLIVPIVVAIVLSFGNDYIVLRSAHAKNQIDLSVLKEGLVASNICLLMGLILAILISNMLFRIIIRQELVVPLQKIRTGMNRIRHGDYDYRIDYEENDPMYELYDDFNEMAVETKRFAVKENQIDERRRQLLLNISHDLRSPMTSIIAYVQGLLDGIAQDEQKRHRYLEVIRAKSLEIDRMVNRLFTYAKLESKEYILDKQPIDIGEYMGDYVMSVSEEYEKKNFRIQLNLVSSARILADTDMFGRICTNLIENAYKYNDKEKGMMKITIKSGRYHVKITFTDNGPGVNADEILNLWDIFYRADHARKNPGQSSGIGLAIVKKAVEMMEGKVEAKSGTNEGLTIIIRIPIID
ncbi:MAG: HAMP domain-containing histidine kinase [Lachnospiraceae bacterium]|nr:HAMP domain-containing histidine kinase [Lachnospiraceae bacterium]